MTKDSKYSALGASASKSGLHSALEKAGLETDHSYFANLTSDLAGDPGYSCFNHCDGAGTKSIISYLRYLATKDPRVFSGLADDAYAMNLDDVICLGIPESMILANVLNRNARLISEDAIEVIVKRYAELAEITNNAGLNIELAGGETADCGDVTRTLVVDATLAGRIKNSNLISCNNIETGDAIIGLSSTGQASYESSENSGIGSNGLTLARHSLLSWKEIGKNEDCIDVFKEGLSYCGKYGLEDKLEGTSLNIGEALSSPTRLYAPILKNVLDALGKEIHGLIHVSGGGLTKVLRFGVGKRYIKDNLFPTPPMFKAIQESGQVGWKEMYQVFNMGCRMEIYTAEKNLEQIKNIASSFNIEARKIGYVEDSKSEKNQVSVRSENGDFDYQLD